MKRVRATGASQLRRIRFSAWTLRLTQPAGVEERHGFTEPPLLHQVGEAQFGWWRSSAALLIWGKSPCVRMGCACSGQKEVKNDKRRHDAQTKHIVSASALGWSLQLHKCLMSACIERSLCSFRRGAARLWTVMALTLVSPYLRIQIVVVFFCSWLDDEDIFLRKEQTKCFNCWSSLSAECMYVALHDFKSTNDSDLPFKQGEKLKVLQAWVDFQRAHTIHTPLFLPQTI